jgi:uncharacterized protein YacL
LDREVRSNLLLFRVILVILLGLAAGRLQPFGLTPLLSAALGVASGLLAVGLEIRLRHLPLKQLIGAVIGLFSGTVCGVLFVVGFHSNGGLIPILVPVVTAYTGAAIGLIKSESWQWKSLAAQDASGTAIPKVLDTSVIIDGRIADIAEAGFLEGGFLIPQFVLRELQMVADSADSARRNRGRRGLDIVQRLQKLPGITVELIPDDPQNVREVDLKLLEVAKIRHARVVTNDFNLNKVAQVHGVQVLNINELANALKPVVLPGEIMRVFILKEGKEYNQGVAYLDDGTMVVVDNARRCISKTIDITVTSVLQTTAGKMIFGKYDERHADRAGASAAGAVASVSAAKEMAPPVG